MSKSLSNCMLNTDLSRFLTLAGKSGKLSSLCIFHLCDGNFRLNFKQFGHGTLYHLSLESNQTRWPCSVSRQRRGDSTWSTTGIQWFYFIERKLHRLFVKTQIILHLPPGKKEKVRYSHSISINFTRWHRLKFEEMPKLNLKHKGGKHFLIHFY